MEEVTQGFSVSTIAAAKAIVEDTIDAAYEISAGRYVPSTFKADIMLYAVASRSGDGTKKYSMQTTLHAYHATAVNTTMKDNLTPVFTEWEDTITDSGLYKTVSNVSGRVTIRPDDFVHLTIIPSAHGRTVEQDGNWDTCHDAEVSDSILTSPATGAIGGVTSDYVIYRTHYNITLSGISVTLTGVEFRFLGLDYGGVKLAVFKGTHTGSSIDDTDYDAFDETALYGTVDDWDDSDWNTFTFNAAGIAYIQSIVDASGIARLCIREYDYDYLDVAPSEFVVAGGYGLGAASGSRPELRLSK